MVFENIPKPFPCKANNEDDIECDNTDCPFRKRFGIYGCIIPTYTFDKIVRDVTNDKYTLFNPLTPKELEEILEALKKKKYADENLEDLRLHLIEYIELLQKTLGENFILTVSF